MSERLQEAIRIVLETEGREGVDRLRDALAEVGDVSAETVRDTERLLDSLNGLNEAAARADRYGQMADELQRAQTALDQASQAAYQLSLQLGATEKPSKQLVAAQKEARSEVERLEKAVTSQWAALQREDDALQKLGVNTADLGSAQSALRNDIGRTTTALDQQVGSVRREAEALRLLGDRLEEGDEKFRRFARAGQVSADALAAYRARTAGAAEETRKLEGAAGGLTGVFGKLRGVLAGAAAYFGFREAARGVGSLLKVGAAAEDARRSLQNLYGGQDAGNKAFDRLKALAKENGLEFQSLVDSAKKLKAFGLDPLNGSLKALIDQNAAVGGSQQDLEGKILALGQAWAKQKLQGEEILQLVERGVPVWDLLQKATGKNVQELQKLSEQGKLGRDVIKALYEEIGKANAGAAQQGLTGLSGLLQQVSARWNEFLNRVADSGITEYFKREIGSLLGSTRDLDGMAKRVADAIIGVVGSVKRFAIEIAPIGKAILGLTQFLSVHAASLVQIAKAYAALIVVRTITPFLGAFGAQIAAVGTSADVSGKKVGVFGRALGALPRDVRIALAIAGYEAVLSATAEITNQLTKNSEAIRAAGESGRRFRDELYQQAIAFRQVAVANVQYRDAAILTASDLAKATTEEKRSYSERLQGLLEYQKAQAKFLINFKAMGIATTDQLTELSALRVGMEATRKAQDELSLAMKRGAEVVKSAAEEFAKAAENGFDKLIDSGKNAREAVSGIFKDLDFADPVQLQKSLLSFDEISGKSKQAASAIREELRKELSEVADSDLPALKGAAEFAFSTGIKGAEYFAEAVNSINLSRLGVDIEAIKTGFTRTGRVVVDQFKASIREVDKLGLTAAQKSQAIATAFDSAFAKASTSVELESLKNALNDAVSAGSLGFVEFQARVDGVNTKLDELKNKGKKAPEALNDGLDDTVPKLRDVQREADKAADSVEKIGDAGSSIAGGIDAANTAAQSFSYAISGVSEEYVRLLRTQNDWQLTLQLYAQQRELRAAVAEAKNLNAEFDSLYGKRGELQKKFNLVDPNMVEELVQVEKSLEDNRKRSAEEQKRIADEAKRAAQEALDEVRKLDAERAQAGLETLSVFRLEIVAAEGVGAKLINGGRIDPATARMLAAAIASPLLERIGRARDGSNQPRRRTR